MSRYLLAAVLLACGAARGDSPAPVACQVKDFTLTNARGQRHTPAAWKGQKAAVLFFLGAECPVSNGYAAEMARLAKEYGPRGVLFWGIHPDPDVTAKSASAHAADYGLTFPILLDPRQVLTAQAGVRVVPEAVVLAPDGKVLYRGRIDDRYSPEGKRREVPTTKDLEKALDAALAGKEPLPAAAKAFGCPLPPPATAPAEDVTYTKHVAPILYKHCAGCHRPGEVGPFALLTYKDAAKRANFIKQVTGERRMPPWKAEPGFGDFLDCRRLSDDELRTLDRWAETGAQEGDPRDLPAAPKFPEGWQLGEPDLILKVPEPFTVPADGRDVYRCFVLPTGLAEDRTVSAVEFRPGNRRVVHHALFFLDRRGAARKKDAADPGPGYATFGGIGIIPTGSLGGWAPGAQPRFLPDDTGRLLRKGSDLVLQIHYHPSGKEEKDQSSVGIYFTKKLARQILTGVPLMSRRIDIPAGAERHKVTTNCTLPVDARAVGITPHMHLLGREMKAMAILPDGKKVPLLWVKDWDFNWQDQYLYAKPVALPKGTRLELEAYYDNSTANVHNPNDPPQRVRFGEQTGDEMCLCAVHVVTDRPADRAPLQRDVLRHLAEERGRSFTVSRPAPRTTAPGKPSPPR